MTGSAKDRTCPRCGQVEPTDPEPEECPKVATYDRYQVVPCVLDEGHTGLCMASNGTPFQGREP